MMDERRYGRVVVDGAEPVSHPPSRSRTLIEFFFIIAIAAILAVVLTWPLAAHLGTVGRIDQADGQFAIWNVAWVARTLVVDPLHVYDANIFYPHRGTLAYSENNLGAGALAIPAYWLSGRNPYAAMNAATLIGFVLSAAGMFYLARYLLRRSIGTVPPGAIDGAAAVAAIAYAFCPYIFARTAEMQLLMSWGIPVSMLAFHRAADESGLQRGTVLGLSMAAEAACCGYYGVFLILMVGLAVLVIATVRRWWTNAAFWGAIAVAAIVAIAIVGPLFLPYLRLQRVSGFARPIDDARRYSADWRAYLASSAYAHAWMLPLLKHWNEVLFPGFVATGLGAIGLVFLARSTSVSGGDGRARLARREVVWIYGGLGVLAAWASFGPDAGLYSVLYRTVPLFTWLRAPARFGLVVAFALSLLASYGVVFVASRFRRATVVAGIAAVMTACDVAVPLLMPRAEPVSPAYRLLSTLPRGVLIEMPFYYPQVGLFQHTKYMLASTSHWMPMVNGYSDYIPADFYDHVMTLAPFPSGPAFQILEPDQVRYAMFHMYGYNDINRQEVLDRLKQFERYMRPLYMDEQTRLYEIIAYPPH